MAAIIQTCAFRLPTILFLSPVIFRHCRVRRMGSAAAIICFLEAGLSRGFLPWLIPLRRIRCFSIWRRTIFICWRAARRIGPARRRWGAEPIGTGCHGMGALVLISGLISMLRQND